MATKDCMTSVEIVAESIRLGKLLGPQGRAFFITSGENMCLAYVATPSGTSTHTYGNSWPELIEVVEAKINKEVGSLRAQTIRRMALAIIDITDRLSACSDTNLRADKFDAAEIAEFHLDACDLAEKMASKGPFRVIMSVDQAKVA